VVSKRELSNRLNVVHNYTLLEKEKFEREISDGKIEISHKFFGRKI